ncbi:hypothetical protein BES34_011800 [Leptospira inadai serovar Lyme]|uniref:Lipoprotein n=1 Tax=Leptospira inadai serovar Lyme TaxID=293084 RepID=A0ABX4YHD0_9LEPT|nr:hypothetical protein BES34_011800 [Leptospira inadai serovar Lyme]
MISSFLSITASEVPRISAPPTLVRLIENSNHFSIGRNRDSRHLPFYACNQNSIGSNQAGICSET